MPSYVAMFKLLVQWMLLSFLHLTTAQECLYNYTSHPMVELNCDPYGSQLQLSCAVTGPLYPQFRIQWYLSSTDYTNRMSLGSSSCELNITGEVKYQLRSIASLSMTGPITEMYANQCIWCQVEFGELDVSQTKDGHRLCLGSADDYAGLASCNNKMVVVNSTSFCADFNSPVDLPMSYATTSTISTESGITPSHWMPCTTSLPNHFTSQINPTTTVTSVSSPAKSPSIDDSIFITATPMPTTPKDSKAAITVGAGNTLSNKTNPTPNNTDPNGQGNAMEGELVIAIVVCILFIIIIIILMYFVMRLFRQWKWKRGRESEPNGDGDVNPNSAEPSVAGGIARGYNVERFHIDSESLFLSALDDDGILTTRSLQDLSHQQTAPPIPPKPWKKSPTKSSSTSALNFRHLSHGYNNFTFPEDRPDGDQQSAVPPPIPIRSKSRDHFYHTLECSHTADSGLVLYSPQFSHRSSSPGVDNSMEQESDAVRELFDDPRYVALLVDGDVDVEEGNLRGRKAIWRSTPALASTRLTGRGGSERRSLRLTQVVGTQIYN